MNKNFILMSMALALCIGTLGCSTIEESTDTNSRMETIVTEKNTDVKNSETENYEETNHVETDTEKEQAMPKKKDDKQQMQVAKVPDFDSIDGYWYIDGESNKAHIYISKTGTFTAYYADGNIETTGYIEYEAEEVEDTINYWYMLYTDEDQFYFGFLDDGNIEKTDFFVGNGGYPHYVWMYGEGGIGDDGRGADEIAADAYIGTWGCGRATLRISRNEDDTFIAVIEWADSAFAYVKWVYPLIYDMKSDSMICKGQATKIYYESTDGLTHDESIIYTDGSASFKIINEVIIWNDYTENSGEDMEFTN